MIPTNSAWHDKLEVKKGDCGEDIVQRYFENKGYSVYKSVSNKAHQFDFICMKSGCQSLYVEVKTKRRRNKYPDTGFNLRNYKIYKESSVRDNKRMYICFVDPGLKKIYGNFLDILDKKRIAEDEKRRIQYPRIERGRSNYGSAEIIYFPLSAMQHIADLSDEQLNILLKLYGGDRSGW